MKNSARWRVGLAIGFGIAAVVVARADTVSTTNAGAWDGPVWTPHAPNAGDVAVLKHNLTLSNATVALAACTNTAGKMLTFSTTNAVLNAAVVWVDGTLTHTNESATTTNLLGQWIKDNWVSIVSSNLTISTSGTINVNARGYQGRIALNGCGPGGGGGGGGSPPWGGGGYGGAGGTSKGGTNYSSIVSPAEPGSGGGSWNLTEDYNGGGHGGGLVRIDATGGKVTLNGSIQANGSDGGSSRGGGGSGGGVWIVCSTFEGSNGTVAANGGIGQDAYSYAGGGGGGRISIQYDPVAQGNLSVKPTLMTISAHGGGMFLGRGRPGTVYMPDNTVLTAGRLQGGQIFGFDTWTVPSLNLTSNDAVVVFTNGFQLTVTNDLICSGARSAIEMSNGVLNVGGSLTMTNAGNGLFYNCAVAITNSLSLGLGTFTTVAVDTNGAALNVGGNLTANSTVLYSYCTQTNIFTANIGGSVLLTNNTKWYVYSAMTNSATPYYGALVSAGGDFQITSNSWIYPYSHATNGGSPTFRMKNLTIAVTAGIDASAKGYSNGAAVGYGPGGGGSGSPWGGGGYGGVGGSAFGGATYGSAMSPSDPGSAGGSYNFTTDLSNKGGIGGGLVRIEAPLGKVTVDGGILANGEGGGSSRGGGGSGGGIWIACSTFAGNSGAILANGGDGHDNAYGFSGGGSGGRVSIQYDPVAQGNLAVKPALMAISARGGGTGRCPGRPGTVYMPDNTVLASGFFQGGQVFGFNGWTMPGLTLTNNDAVALFTNGFQLTVTGDLLCSGARSGIEMSNGVLNVGGSLMITNGGNGIFYNCAVTISSNLGLGAGVFTTFAANTNSATLRVGGNLTANSDALYSYCSSSNIFTANIGGNVILTNNSSWYVYSAMTNSGTPYYGALVSIGGNLLLASNSWIYPYSQGTNGGSPAFRMKNLTISTNAGFDATGRGFAYNPISIGYGPGGGKGGNDCSGGGYGGVGGKSATWPGGTNYGSAMFPFSPGSAGGSSTYGDVNNVGGSGGGLVRIEAPQGLVTFGGTIRTDGADGGSARGGGGSGGGIYILCNRFAGQNGLFSAKGGNATGTGGGAPSGGGGGGRIAVWRVIDAGGSISSNVAGGTTTNSVPSGQVGTFYWGSVPAAGTLIQFR